MTGGLTTGRAERIANASLVGLQSDLNQVLRSREKQRKREKIYISALSVVVF